MFQVEQPEKAKLMLIKSVRGSGETKLFDPCRTELVEESLSDMGALTSADLVRLILLLVCKGS